LSIKAPKFERGFQAAGQIHSQYRSRLFKTTIRQNLANSKDLPDLKCSGVGGFDRLLVLNAGLQKSIKTTLTKFFEYKHVAT
jgi:elongation factor P--beta-lysine ligase